MKAHVDLNRFPLRSSVVILVVIILSLGFLFRCVNLDKKAYWYDETFTSLQLSGYSAEEVEEQILNGREIGLEELQRYQYPDSSSNKSVVDTVKRIAIVEPQLTPLYFVLARYWVQWFGNSITVIRSLSVVFSLLALLCMYWLCMELFNSAFTAGIATALVAVSPFHVLYAQEARPYSLWTTAIAFSCVLLLRAMRRQTPLDWITYAFTVTISLYSFLLSILVYIANGFYVLIIERFTLSKRAISYVAATLIGFLPFIPWMYVVLTNVSGIESEGSFRTQSVPLLQYGIKLVRSIHLFFVDFWINEDSPLYKLIPFTLALFLILAISAYSIFFLCFYAPRRARLFILALIVIPIISLVLPDIVLGGQRGTTTRYVIPSFLGLQMAVAYLLSTMITQVSTPAWQSKAWRGVLVAVVSLGILSCTTITFSNTWWTKADENINHQLAHIINQTEHPLLISDVWFVKVLSLSHMLDRKVRFQLVSKPSIPEVRDGFSNIFLYQPSDEFKSTLEEYYAMQLVAPQLWSLERK